MTETDSPSLTVAALNWAYDRAASSLPGLGGAEALGKQYLAAAGGSRELAIARLVTWQVRYAGAAGFLSNVGGLVTIPLSLPANLASVLLIQLRMIAAIAHLRGYRVSDAQVKTLALVCLTGRASTGLLRDLSVGLGTQLTTAAIMKLSGGVLGRINHTVGLRLATRAGSAGLFSAARIVPVVGGVVGGGFDAAVTRGVAEVAKRVFTPLAEGSQHDETGIDRLGAGEWLADDRRLPQPDQAIIPQGGDRAVGVEGDGSRSGSQEAGRQVGEIGQRGLRQGDGGPG